ncbi:MAG: L,D-transpeptidase [Anaerolineaceae bacterium]
MKRINRRDFLKLGLLSAGSLAFIHQPYPWLSGVNGLPDFPKATRLGRVFHSADVKSKPDPASSTVETLFQDHVVEWQRDIIGQAPSTYSTNRKWVETPSGYIAAIDLQPVQAILNEPVKELPQQIEAKGFWAEVTVPFVDLLLANPPARAPLLQDLLDHSQSPRLYYSQIFWVDDLRIDDQGNTQYHILEKYGSPGDTFWADARAFRQITPEDVSPISPDVNDKSIVVDLTHQTLACYEGKREILFSRVSTGAKFNSEGQPVPEAWSTPPGLYHAVTTKYISVHMSGGSAASGYELFGVCWTCIFAIGGVALHSTFWHNNYGEPMSHGCVNINPEDAKFVYRWTLPQVSYEIGKIEQTGYAGTNVKVIEDTL